jgi:deoxyhypusine synthase
MGDAEQLRDDAQKAAKAVLVNSVAMPEDATQVRGPDFTKLQQSAAHRGYGITVDELLRSMTTTGFQASSVGQAAAVIEQMVSLNSLKQPC